MSRKPGQDIIQISNATIEIIDIDICHVKFAAGIVLELEDFIETRETFEELSRDKQLKGLYEFANYTTATYEARMYAQESVIESIAGAIVFNSLAQRILVRSYYLFNKQSHPVRIFTNREKAIEWLNSF